MAAACEDESDENGGAAVNGQVVHLGPPYDGMVTRLHDRCMELLTVARQGNRHATADAAERLAAQARALAELLGMKKGRSDF